MDKIIDTIRTYYPEANFREQGYLLWVWQDGKLIERFDLNHLTYLHENNELNNHLKEIKK